SSVIKQQLHEIFKDLDLRNLSCGRVVKCVTCVCCFFTDNSSNARKNVAIKKEDNNKISKNSPETTADLNDNKQQQQKFYQQRAKNKKNPLMEEFLNNKNFNDKEFRFNEKRRARQFVSELSTIKERKISYK